MIISIKAITSSDNNQFLNQINEYVAEIQSAGLTADIKYSTALLGQQVVQSVLILRMSVNK